MAISHSQLRRGRRAAEADMRDACTVRRDLGETAWDDAAGKDVPVLSVVRAGKCEVRQSEQITVTQSGLTVEGYLVKLPVDAFEYRIGDEITLDACRFDQALVRRKFTVTKLAAGSHVTSRRLLVKEVT